MPPGVDHVLSKPPKLIELRAAIANHFGGEAGVASEERDDRQADAVPMELADARVAEHHVPRAGQPAVSGLEPERVLAARTKAPARTEVFAGGRNAPHQVRPVSEPVFQVAPAVRK